MILLKWQLCLFKAAGLFKGFKCKNRSEGHYETAGQFNHFEGGQSNSCAKWSMNSPIGMPKGFTANIILFDGVASDILNQAVG